MKQRRLRHLGVKMRRGEETGLKMRWNSDSDQRKGEEIVLLWKGRYVGMRGKVLTEAGCCWRCIGLLRSLGIGDGMERFEVW